MSNRILVFYGSYRSDRMGIRLAQFVVDHRVVRGVARGAVLGNHVFAEDSLELRAERLKRATGALIPCVGLELDPPASDHLECLGQEQQLGLDVDAASPHALRQPSPADLDPEMLETDLEKAGRADRPPGLRREDRERHFATAPRRLERPVKPASQPLLGSR